MITDRRPQPGCRKVINPRAGIPAQPKKLSGSITAPARQSSQRHAPSSSASGQGRLGHPRASLGGRALHQTFAMVGAMAALCMAIAPAQAGPSPYPAPAPLPNPLPKSGVPCQGNSDNDIMVRVGSLCVDKYEASVWSEPGGAGTQYPQSNPRYPSSFAVNGNWTVPLFAASVPNVFPSTFLTWFQAQQACALSGKRLLSNAEWQMAAASTPDPGFAGDGIQSCNTNTPSPQRTGAASSCISRWGVMDMVGNVSEWVADWIQGEGISTNGSPYANWNPPWLTTSTTTYGEDSIAGINEAVHLEAPQAGPAIGGPDAMPAAITRGGFWLGRAGAGVFALYAGHTPSSLDNATGFRCGR